MRLIPAALLVLLAAAPASAQQAELWPQRDGEPILLDNWTYADVYREGFLGETLLGAPVAGLEGAVLGRVDEAMLAVGGKVVSIIVRLDESPDTRITVPWMDLVHSDPAQAIVVDFLTEDADGFELGGAEAYSAAEGRFATGRVDENIQAERNVLPLTAFLGDPVEFKGGGRGAAVQDVILDADGYVRAVLISLDGDRRELKAVPFQGIDPDWTAAEGVLPLPYARADVAGLAAFQPARLD